MGDLQVTRWRKYGKDRLYVNDDAGERIGWVDLVAGSHQLARPDLVEAFRAAVHGFCHDHDLVAPRLTATPSSPASQQPAAAPLAPTADQSANAVAEEPVATPEETKGWQDLALNVPGQAARAQAQAELVALRDRSRVGAFLARALDVKTDERAWRVGAGGEETVGAKLEKLTKRGWHVLHAVPVGERGSDIDHVLIGPGGVWTLNTKTHPGGRVWVGRHSVRVNGQQTPYLRNSRFEAERAQRLLTEACGFPVFVKAALVFLTGTLFPDVTVKQAPDDVAILDRMDIPGAFRRASRLLTDVQVSAIYEQARRSSTWRP